MYHFIPKLEQATGNRITERTLAEAINQVGYAQYELSRFLEYRKYSPALLRGTQVMAAMNAYTYMSARKWAA